jgi:hypothetical protein
MSMPAQSGARQVQCAQCLAMNWVPDGVDPHSLTWCDCCTQDHHHGEGVLSAEECAAANHPGQPCLRPPEVRERPDGCTVCRPVIHYAVAGQVLPA